VQSERNTNIGKITENEIFLNEGNIFIYTVDTEAGKSLTTLKISNVASLFDRIASKDNSNQSYVVKSVGNMPKVETDETVNVIGRGTDGTQTLIFTGLDLRAKNRQDLEITFLNASLPEGRYEFSADYSLTLDKPERLNSGTCFTHLKVVKTSFTRILDRSLIYREDETTYSRPTFTGIRRR
jgi:hypothetical protein